MRNGTLGCSYYYYERQQAPPCNSSMYYAESMWCGVPRDYSRHNDNDNPGYAYINDGYRYRFACHDRYDHDGPPAVLQHQPSSQQRTNMSATTRRPQNSYTHIKSTNTAP